MQKLDQWPRPGGPRLPEGQAGGRGRVPVRDRERARDAGAPLQSLRHRGRRHGL